MLGYVRSHMSEVMWEIIVLFMKKYGHALELCGNLLRSRAAIYTTAINEAGAPLKRCVGFIDCTKIKMNQPGGHNFFQRSAFSGHKRFHCLISQTLTTPDGLVFALFVSEVGRRHDLTLLRENGWSEKLEECFLIDGMYYYIYGDSAYLLRP